MNVLLASSSPRLQQSLAAAISDAGHHVRALLAEPLDGGATRPDGVEWLIASAPPTVYDAARDCEAAVIVHRSVTPRVGPVNEREDDLVDWADDAVGRGVQRIVRVAGAKTAWPRRHSPRLRAQETIFVISSPVYGITDDPITVLLLMMRSLPAVPITSDGTQLRPLWHEDLSQALARIVALPASELPDPIRIEGPDRVTSPELYDRIASIIGRRPARIPVPEFLAAHGARLADALGLPLPFDGVRLAPADGVADDDRASHTLAAPFGVRSTALDDGLRRVVAELEELPPAEGVGALEVKRFSIDIERPQLGASEMIHLLRTRFRDVMPIDIGVEPASSNTSLNEGATVTMSLPGRGHVQVRVEEVADDHVIVATLRGHVLAGMVRFATHAIPQGVRFEVMTCDRAANIADWIGLRLGGARLQDGNWSRVVQNVASLAGGQAGELQTDARKLRGEEARQVEQWITNVIERHQARKPATGQSRQTDQSAVS